MFLEEITKWVDDGYPMEEITKWVDDGSPVYTNYLEDDISSNV